MPPVVIAAGVAAAGTVASSAISSGASRRNARTAANAQASEQAFARENRDYQYNLNAPSITYGRAAEDRLAGLYNIGGDPAASQAAFDGWRASTGWNTTRDEALQSVNQRAFAGGVGLSGAAAKALQNRAGDVADRGFNSYASGVNALASAGANARGLVAGVGSNATNQLIQASQQGAQNQIGINNQNTQNLTGGIQNLLNAGLFAYGSSYQNGGGSKPAGDGYILPPSGSGWYQGY